MSTDARGGIKAPHDEVLRVVKSIDRPFATTEDVAVHFDVSERTVRNRLNDLVDDGRLSCREIGASAKVWYVED
jgi:DeoR/GlpR family transcriptional regulator of sugar metabolism